MLARKISRAKWDPVGYLADGEIRADAITLCLRTENDTLSWWHCESDGQDVAEVALALISAPRVERFDKIDVVVISENELKGAGLSYESTQGDTPIKELRSRHVNVVKLDLERLARIGRILAPEIRLGESVHRFTKDQLIALVRKAIQDKRLNPNDLNENLQRKLANALGGPSV